MLFSYFYRPQRSWGQGNIFTPVCHSVHSWGGWGWGCLPQCMLECHTPPVRHPSLGADTQPLSNPWSRHPPGSDTPRGQTPPSRHAPGQTLPPGADPPGQTHRPMSRTPPWVRHAPQVRHAPRD